MVNEEFSVILYHNVISPVTGEHISIDTPLKFSMIFSGDRYERSALTGKHQLDEFLGRLKNDIKVREFFSANKTESVLEQRMD